MCPEITMAQMKLTAHERRALELLLEHGGAMLESQIPEVNELVLVFGETNPGLGVYRKLAKRNLCFFTEEDPCDLPGLAGFCFTPEVYISDEGRNALRSAT